ncbi:phenylalanine 4-monooxygenase, partial [Vibrio makurazakiensis]
MSKYHSKPVSADGFVDWSKEEDKIWHDLVTRQLAVVNGRACSAYLEGLDTLNLPLDKVPQLPDINSIL